MQFDQPHFGVHFLLISKYFIRGDVYLSNPFKSVVVEYWSTATFLARHEIGDEARNRRPC